jgi:hypothetical protein
MPRLFKSLIGCSLIAVLLAGCTPSTLPDQQRTWPSTAAEFEDALANREALNCTLGSDLLQTNTGWTNVHTQSGSGTTEKHYLLIEGDGVYSWTNGEGTKTADDHWQWVSDIAHEFTPEHGEVVSCSDPSGVTFDPPRGIDF